MATPQRLRHKARASRNAGAEGLCCSASGQNLHCAQKHPFKHVPRFRSELGICRNTHRLLVSPPHSPSLQPLISTRLQQYVPAAENGKQRLTTRCTRLFQVLNPCQWYLWSPSGVTLVSLEEIHILPLLQAHHLVGESNWCETRTIRPSHPTTLQPARFPSSSQDCSRL